MTMDDLRLKKTSSQHKSTSQSEISSQQRQRSNSSSSTSSSSSSSGTLVVSGSNGHKSPLSQGGGGDHSTTVTIVPIDKDAPISDEWYHGSLDREQAEKRLGRANLLGGFLVRESKRKKQQSFVLSYYSLTRQCYHFEITPVFGDYYIGGRQFDRLDTLVSYYMYYSELVKGEKLVHAVAPPIICRLERICVSTRPYKSNSGQKSSSNTPGLCKSVTCALLNSSTTANSSSSGSVCSRTSGGDATSSGNDDILYFDSTGETFRVFHKISADSSMADEDEWYWAQACRTSQCGLLCGSCVKFIDDEKSHEYEQWYYSDITKEEAASILASAGSCSFLVRPSDRSPGNFTLFFNADNVVHRFPIVTLPFAALSWSAAKASSSAEKEEEYDDDDDENRQQLLHYSTTTSSKSYFQIGGRNFTNISSIVERYKNEDIIDGFRLSKSASAHLRFNTTTNNYICTQHRHPPLTASKSSLPIKKTQATPTTNPNLVKSNSISSSQQQSEMSKSTITTTATTSATGASAKKTTTVSSLQKMKHNQFSLSFDGANPPSTSSTSSSSANCYYTDISDLNSTSSANSTQTTTLTTTTATIAPKQQNPYPLATAAPVNHHHHIKSSNSIASWVISRRKGSGGSGGTTPAAAATQHSSTALLLLNRKANEQNALRGYLNRYHEKTKKWKSYFFILSRNDKKLFYFSNNDKKMKEKGLIDLNYGYFYPLDDSFFNKSYCFQVIIHPLGDSSSNITHYLCAENLKQFKEWSENIRLLCSPAQYQNPSTSLKKATSDADLLDTSSSSSSSFSSSSSSSSLASASSTSLLRTLNIEIHEARNVYFAGGGNSSSSGSGSSAAVYQKDKLKFHKENLFYCLVVFNADAFVASTRFVETSDDSLSYENKNAIWDDSFSFDSVPLDVRELKICLFAMPAKDGDHLSKFLLNSSNYLHLGGGGASTTKMLEPLLIGYINIRLSDLVNRGQVESWYNVEPALVPSAATATTPAAATSSCTLRMKLRFCEEHIVLNSSHYLSLSQYLIIDARHLSAIYDHIVPSTERAHFVHALLRFYVVSSSQQELVDILRAFLVNEIDHTLDMSTLFRPNTLATSLMESYMRVRCERFLHIALEEPLARLFAANPHISFELDPAKCPDAQQREQNLSHFQLILRQLLSTICSPQAVQAFPDELKFLFYLVRQHVHTKWLTQEQQQQQQPSAQSPQQDERQVRIYCVSAFVFLRLICPALLNPKHFGLRFLNYTPALAAAASSPQVEQQPSSSGVSGSGGGDINNAYFKLASQFNVFTPCLINNSYLSSINCIVSNITPASSSTSSSASSFLASSSASTSSTNETYERNIKLLMKALQTMANMTDFKEPYMSSCMSEFIGTHKSLVVNFLDDISNYTPSQSSSLFAVAEKQIDCPPDASNVDDVMSVLFDAAICKYMAVLTRLFGSYLPQIQSYLGAEQQQQNNDATTAPSSSGVSSTSSSPSAVSSTTSSSASSLLLTAVAEAAAAAAAVAAASPPPPPPPPPSESVVSTNSSYRASLERIVKILSNNTSSNIKDNETQK